MSCRILSDNPAISCRMPDIRPDYSGTAGYPAQPFFHWCWNYIVFVFIHGVRLSISNLLIKYVQLHQQEISKYRKKCFGLEDYLMEPSVIPMVALSGTSTHAFYRYERNLCSIGQQRKRLNSCSYHNISILQNWVKLSNELQLALKLVALWNKSFHGDFYSFSSIY